MRRAVGIPLALLLACGGGGDADRAPREAASPVDTVAWNAARDSAPIRGRDGLEVRLTGSIPWETALASGAYRRVVVVHGGEVDTLADVAVSERPVVPGDSSVHGFDRAGGEVERGFVWRPGEGVVGVDLPGDFPGFTAFALAPDARHLAYVGLADGEESGMLRAVVRTWPDLDVVAETAAVTGYPSDAANSAVEWISADSVRVEIRLDDRETEGGSWLRFRGSPSTGAFASDTVRGG